MRRIPKSIIKWYYWEFGNEKKASSNSGHTFQHICDRALVLRLAVYSNPAPITRWWVVLHHLVNLPAIHPYLDSNYYLVLSIDWAMLNRNHYQLTWYHFHLARAKLNEYTQSEKNVFFVHFFVVVWLLKNWNVIDIQLNKILHTKYLSHLIDCTTARK